MHPCPAEAAGKGKGASDGVVSVSAVELQKKFQTSSSVQRLPGKTETGKEIALQGNLLKVRPQMPWQIAPLRTGTDCQQ